MVLHWLDERLTVRRWSYSDDKATLSTVHTNVWFSLQQDDVPSAVGGGGQVTRTYTGFTDDGTTFLEEDRVVDSNGVEYVVKGVKVVDSGTEPYTQLTLEEAHG